MNRAYYSDSLAAFRSKHVNTILGILARSNDFALEATQRDAWLEQISVLKSVLAPFEGSIYFEYSIPRMGRRIDVVILIGPAIFILEFKVGETEFAGHSIDQVFDYALDLKNFHETSSERWIAPVLIATKAQGVAAIVIATPQNDKVLFPIKCNTASLGNVIEEVLRFTEGASIDSSSWERGRYCPTPTIIEAAMALYNNHSVAEISRSDASATNLSDTSDTIAKIIQYSKDHAQKSIYFVTGVPGAGKTLVGLNIATQHIDHEILSNLVDERN